MCGRFTLRTNSAAWCQQFLPNLDPADWSPAAAPRYNIAPTQMIPCILRETTGDPRKVVTMRWGLVPPWAKDLAIGNRMINARGETVDEKPSFRKSLMARRCLIPADGYFEWQKTSDGKQPYLIEMAAGGVFAMAGLWEENRKATGDGTTLLSCTVITTDANRTTGQVHDRMPVILDPDQYDRWLDPGFRDTGALKGMLDSAAEDLLELTPVSRHVNNPKNDDAQCVSPLTL